MHYAECFLGMLLRSPFILKPFVFNGLRLYVAANRLCMLCIIMHAVGKDWSRASGRAFFLLGRKLGGNLGGPAIAGGPGKHF
jgi:hypothetical protein